MFVQIIQTVTRKQFWFKIVKMIHVLHYPNDPIPCLHNRPFADNNIIVNFIKTFDNTDNIKDKPLIS